MIAGLVIPCSGQNLLQNPSFESGLTDWNPVGSVAARADASAQFDSGNYAVFNRHDQPPSGSIWQAVTTTPSQVYRLTFHFAAHYAGAGSIRVDVFDGTGIDGTIIHSTTFTASYDRITYQQAETSFVAGSGTSTVVFTDVSPRTIATDLYIDNVIVHPPDKPQNLTIEAITAEEMVLHFDSVAGVEYSIQASNTLLPDSFAEVGTEIGDGSRISHHHFLESPRLFYKVESR